MVIEAGVGRDKANPQQARECTKINKLISELTLTANKSLETMHIADVQG